MGNVSKRRGRKQEKTPKCMAKKVESRPLLINSILGSNYGEEIDFNFLRITTLASELWIKSEELLPRTTPRYGNRQADTYACSQADRHAHKQLGMQADIEARRQKGSIEPSMLVDMEEDMQRDIDIGMHILRQGTEVYTSCQASA